MDTQKVNLTASSTALSGKYKPGGIVLVLCDATDAAFTVYAPSAKETMLTMFIFKKTDSGANAVTISFQVGQTGEGASTATLSSQYDTASYINDRSNYHKISGI
jgi:hypothetical protein